MLVVESSYLAGLFFRLHHRITNGRSSSNRLCKSNVRIQRSCKASSAWLRRDNHHSFPLLPYWASHCTGGSIIRTLSCIRVHSSDDFLHDRILGIQILLPQVRNPGRMRQIRVRQLTMGAYGVQGNSLSQPATWWGSPLPDFKTRFQTETLPGDFPFMKLTTSTLDQAPEN